MLGTFTPFVYRLRKEGEVDGFPERELVDPPERYEMLVLKKLTSELPNMFHFNDEFGCESYLLDIDDDQRKDIWAKFTKSLSPRTVLVFEFEAAVIIDTKATFHTIGDRSEYYSNGKLIENGELIYGSWG